MKKGLIFISAALIFIFSCSNVTQFMNNFGGKTDSYHENRLMSRGVVSPSAKMGVTYNNVMMDTATEGASAEQAEPQANESDKKIIKRGSISVSVSTLNKVENDINKKVEEYKGFIESSSSNTASSNYTIKIPAEKFDQFFSEIEKMGIIVSANTYIEDVTSRYYDLENRVKNMKIMVARLQSYLASAKNVEEAIKVEIELNRRIVDLENFERGFKDLSKSVTYSTIDVYFSVPGTKSEVKPLPSILAGLKDFGLMFLNFLYGFFFFILGLVFLGVPIVLLIALIYYVTFGKIGLVRILFKRLSSKDKR